MTSHLVRSLLSSLELVDIIDIDNTEVIDIDIEIFRIQLISTSKFSKLNSIDIEIFKIQLSMSKIIIKNYQKSILIELIFDNFLQYMH